MIEAVHRNEAVSQTRVLEWFKRYRRKREGLDRDPKGSCQLLRHVSSNDLKGSEKNVRALTGIQRAAVNGSESRNSCKISITDERSNAHQAGNSSTIYSLVNPRNSTINRK
jgi:hypothetical protein